MNISIVVPVYNTPADLLVSCVESVYEEAYIASVDVDLIIVDDFSDFHESIFILDFLAAKYPLRFLRNKQNLGVIYSRYAGMMLAKCQFVLFHDSDDRLIPNALLHLKQCLNNLPTFVFGLLPSTTFQLSSLPSSFYLNPMTLDRLLLATYNTGELSLLINLVNYRVIFARSPSPFLFFLRRHEFASLIKHAFICRNQATAVLFDFHFRSYESATHSQGLSVTRFSPRNCHLMSLGHIISSYYLFRLGRLTYSISFFFRSLFYLLISLFSLK